MCAGNIVGDVSAIQREKAVQVRPRRSTWKGNVFMSDVELIRAWLERQVLLEPTHVRPALRRLLRGFDARLWELDEAGKKVEDFSQNH